MRYSTMLHTMLAYRCVLQVLLCRGRRVRGIPPTLGSYGTSISRYPSVSRSARTCETKWGSGTELLACATWRSAEWVHCRYCCAEGQVVLPGLPYPEVLWVLLK